MRPSDDGRRGRVSESETPARIRCLVSPFSARNCVAALLKRLVHRNANVQLYALTLADALSKNCGLVAHRELASRSFCQTLQRIVTDRNTHSTVKNKALKLIKEWSTEWGQDETLGIVRETMDSLKSQGM